MRLGTFGIAAVVFALSTTMVAAEPIPAQLARGKYLVAIMDCTGCHTPGALVGKPDRDRMLAGSEVGFQLPALGVFYPPNLTPDPDTGIGSWSAADIVKALRTGERPDGRVLAPVMPYNSYANMADDDAAAVAAYLKSLKPVRHQVPAPAGLNEKPKAPYLGLIQPE